MRVDYDRNQQGHIRGFLATYSDVDQLKRLELEAGQREHRLRLVTDSVGLPILHFDRQLRLRFANKPFADWIGVPAEDLLGHSLADFLPSDALTEMQGYIERAFAGATVAYERRERRFGRAPLGARHAVPRIMGGRRRRSSSGTTSRTTCAFATR
jgi:PAS domain S-box-containing protein